MWISRASMIRVQPRQKHLYTHQRETTETSSDCLQLWAFRMETALKGQNLAPSVWENNNFLQGMGKQLFPSRYEPFFLQGMGKQ